MHRGSDCRIKPRLLMFTGEKRLLVTVYPLFLDRYKFPYQVIGAHVDLF